MAETARAPRTLFREPDFRRLWISDAASQFGTGVSALAIPLAAVLVLQATAFQVALLRAVGEFVFLVLGLPAGAWCDRVRARPVLIAADVGRAIALGSIPVAAVFGLLSLWQLYLVVACVGLFTVFFDISYQSYLPRLVGRQRLVEGNAKLEANRTVAAVASPGIGGYLVQWLTAPFALAVDAATFAWSAIWIAAIRKREPRPRAPARTRLPVEIGDGLRFVLAHPTLRAIAGYGATSVLFSSASSAIIIVFFVRELGLSAAPIGLLGMIGGVGAVLGAATTTPIARRLGYVRSIRRLVVVGGLFGLLVPLTDTGARLALYGIGAAVTSYCIVAFNIIQVSYRQTICPDHLLGRMNASIRVAIWGAVPLGSVLGGALASTIGLRPTLWVGAIGGLFAVLWLLLSPIVLDELGGTVGHEARIGTT